MRNHGDSPHSDAHTYDAMAEDLAVFLDKQGIDNSVVMGHSMGGKVVMNMCLRRLHPVSKLIVVDMAPDVLPLSSDFGSYVAGMDEIQQAKVTKRSEADAILSKREPNLAIRQFLLTNLKKDEETGIYKFRVPYKILGKSLGQMSAFLNEKTEPFDKPTLFIAGGKSDYIKPERNGQMIKEQFPNSEIKVIEGAGHWGKFHKTHTLLAYCLILLIWCFPYSACWETRGICKHGHGFCFKKMKPRTTRRRSAVDI